MVRAILIAGPTASGKSALALQLAERLSGTIVNADSMQVYRDFRVLTARPTPEEESRVPHLLYGHVDAAENYSAGRWLADASRALTEVERAGRLPVFVGGTGLYFRALIEGLSSMPQVPEQVRAKVRGEAEGVAASDLHARLSACDPATAAGLRPTDRQRILRALEIFEATGRPLAEWQAAPGKPLIEPGDTAAVFLAVERAELRARIDARFDKMLAAGALEEVRAFAARGLDASLPAMKAHGAPWLMRHLAGEISLEEAAKGGKADTRQYAKRQETWFRHQLPQFERLAPESALEALLGRAQFHARGLARP
ncbi:MAG TPA: tRNA (adenosine(37)-N6)-dimethylallyltransferase MiaA [Xanthobacteraceae bacterium]|nr:tRNA (adenosine(37)-N6)-dimethylallyltransferase MiaA [Xanthobacteraceae bacterium]